MNSGTPEIFNLEQDPFPHLITRDALIVTSSFIIKHSTIKGKSVTLEEELEGAPKLDNPTSNTIRAFIEMTIPRYDRLPPPVELGCFHYWNALWVICHSHLLQTRQGFGSEQPEPGSAEQIILREQEHIFSSQQKETVRKGQQLINVANYLELLNVVLKTELTRDLWPLSENKPFQDGTYSAYADSRLLLTLLEYPSSPGEESL